MIMTPMNTNSVVMHQINFSHSCEKLDTVHTTLDMVLAVQMVIMIAFIWIIRKLKRVPIHVPNKNTIHPLLS